MPEKQRSRWLLIVVPGRRARRKAAWQLSADTAQLVAAEEPSLSPHSHSLLCEFTPNGFVDEGKLRGPLLKRLHGSTVAAVPAVMQLLLMISITSSGKRSTFVAFQ